MRNQTKNHVDSRVLKQTWASMRATFSQAPEKYKQLAESLPEIFAKSETDIDLRQKREVYLIIAKFLGKNFQKPLPVCLGSTHILCDEDDPRLLLDGVLDDEASQLAISAKKAILSIKVLYEPLPNRFYNRLIEIFWLNNDKTTANKTEEEVPWDYLPPDIREKRFHVGAEAETLSFKLYPQET